MKGILKQKIKRLNVKLQKLFNNSSYRSITHNERCAMIIANELISDKESELLLHPTADKFYIKNKKHQIFVILDLSKTEVMIINHRFCYIIHLSQRPLDYIHSLFIDEVEQRRCTMENEYMNNIQNSLTQITTTVKNIKNEKP